MERTKNQTAFIFLLFLLISVIAPVSAATFTFVDSSYLEQNDYTISDNNGATVANFSGGSTVTLNGGKSYTVNFQPRGLFDFSDQQPGSLTYPSETISFFIDNIGGIVALFGIGLVAVTYRGHS